MLGDVGAVLGRVELDLRYFSYTRLFAPAMTIAYRKMLAIDGMDVFKPLRERSDDPGSQDRTAQSIPPPYIARNRPATTGPSRATIRSTPCAFGWMPSGSISARLPITPARMNGSSVASYRFAMSGQMRLNAAA